MSRWDDAFKATLRELFSPTPDEEPPVDQLELDTQARTEWVRSHRHPGGGELAMRLHWDW